MSTNDIDDADVIEGNLFSELLDTISGEYDTYLEGILTEVSGNAMSMSMPAEMGTDVNTSLETLLFKHGEHWPEYDNDAKCLILHKILKLICKYPHHGKSGKSGGISSTSNSGDWEWHDPFGKPSSPSTSGKSGKSGSKKGDNDYLCKKIEYLIEYKCNKVETTTTVGHSHYVCSLYYTVV